MVVTTPFFFQLLLDLKSLFAILQLLHISHIQSAQLAEVNAQSCSAFGLQKREVRMISPKTVFV